MSKLGPKIQVDSSFDLVQGAIILGETWNTVEGGHNLEQVILGGNCLCRPNDLRHYRAVSLIIIEKKTLEINGFLNKVSLEAFLANPNPDIYQFIQVCLQNSPPNINLGKCSYTICFEYEPNPLPLPGEFCFFTSAFCSDSS